MNDTAERVLEALYTVYPESACGLSYGGDPFRLFVMAVLSAQCTDERVNAVSGPLFERFPDARSMADSAPGELEKYIYTVGLYNSKAEALRTACRRLVDVYNGVLPSDMDSLLSLRGVGRKVANLLRGDIFGLGGIVADTHCIRISRRIGLTSSADPLTTERELSAVIPVEYQSGFCHRMVMFGREYCIARSPRCGECPVSSLCAKNGVKA